MKEKGEEQNLAFSPLAIIGFILAALAGAAEMLAGFGSQWGLWYFRTGFVILRWAAYCGMVAAMVSLAACILTRPGSRRKGLIFSSIGLLVGIVVVAIPWFYWQTARRVPPIHDITTDTENPPRFTALLPLRKNAPNPGEYGGPEIAAKQRAAYPDIVPFEISIPPGQAFKRALSIARSMGWQMIDVNQSEGQLEATDTTFWFGFKDDIIIRITSTTLGSRIDIRSVSRVGKSDLGTNSKRIRAYLKKLREMG
jgi:uncharacterized protein (DUF1499 family)